MLFQCVIIFSIVSTAAGVCSSAVTYKEKDCVGHDIEPSGSTGYPVANFAECQLDCHSNPPCLSFEYDSVNKKCFFKDFKCTTTTMTASAFPVGQLSYSVCGIGNCPAVTAYPEKDCVGHDLATSSGTAAATTYDCRVICSADISCVSYEYDQITHKCYPKNYQCAGAEITASTYPIGELTYYTCGAGTCPAVTTYTDKDCVGHDLATSSGTTAANESECQAICASNPACVSFVYAFTMHKCFPKNYKCAGAEITAATFPAGTISYYTC